MKIQHLLISLFIALICNACQSKEESSEQAQNTPQPDKPNIIVILADDMGYSDLGCYGSEISTPNIDQLAADGLKMTQFYNFTRCSPSRASLLTGLYPHQAGMGGHNPQLGPGYLGHLNQQCATLPELLTPQGYKSYMAGKWHVGTDDGHWPLDHGFDKFFGLINGASSYYGVCEFRTVTQSHKSKFAYMNEEFTPPTEDRFYSTHAYTDTALSFLDAHDKSKPFFLYMAYQAPHWPLHAPEETIKKYEGKYMDGWDSLRISRLKGMIEAGVWKGDAGISDKYPDFHQWDTLSLADKKYWDRLMAIYAATIDEMDTQIGRLVNYLDENNMSENTLIVFLSDNGACYDDYTVIKGFKKLGFKSKMQLF